MKAMILAAGRGERMRPLTDHTPKPLLAVHGKPLIEWHLEALARGGVRDVVINTAWREAQIVAALGDGARWGLAIRYSMEGRDHGGALETAGGIAKALPLLTDREDDTFWLVSGDIFAPAFRFDAGSAERFRKGEALAHLWLVPNPPHNPRGDFGLSDDGLALNLPPDDAGPRYTYSTIGLYRRALFDGLSFGNQQGLATPLAPLLRAAMDRSQVSAELYEGAWTDVGTPARLAELNQNL